MSSLPLPIKDGWFYRLAFPDLKTHGFSLWQDDQSNLTQQSHFDTSMPALTLPFFTCSRASHWWKSLYWSTKFLRLPAIVSFSLYQTSFLDIEFSSLHSVRGRGWADTSLRYFWLWRSHILAKRLSIGLYPQNYPDRSGHSLVGLPTLLLE